jgi:hypothetical protein
VVALAESVRGAVVINEIHYNPDVKTEQVEFIELHNSGGSTVDCGSWALTDGVEFVFPAGTQIQAGGFLVVAGSPASVQAKYRTAALGPWTGRLSNEGETVVLRNAGGRIEDEVEYKLGFPWPTVGDPPGNSIELIHPALDNNLGGSWRRSATGGGTTADVDLLPAGSSWRYFKGTAEPSTPTAAWRARTFDDSSWQVGTTPIGYGENFLATPLSDMRNGYTSVYLRRKFTVASPAGISALQLGALFDDGFLVWINGVRVQGQNMPGNEVAFDAGANSALESMDFQAFDLPLPSSYLVTGENVIAVQAHNVSLNGSSDFFIDLRLTAQSGPANRGPTPGQANIVFRPTRLPRSGR